MSTPTGADEQRTRRNLRALGVSYAPQPSDDARERDWLDDLWDGEDAPAPRRRPVVPPAPPDDPPETTAGADEPGWDWRRLLRWPHARPAVTASLALAAVVAPIPPGGYSAAVTWAYCMSQLHDQYGSGWAYAIGGGAFALAVWLVARRGRRSGVLRITFLAITGIGLTGFVSWFDLITFVTGVTK